MTIRKSASVAFDENHLCPLITYSSPSRTARRGEQRRVGARARLGHREAAAQLAAQQRVHPALLLLRRCRRWRAARRCRSRAPGCRRSPRRVAALAEDLVHQPELDLAEPAAAELRRQVRGPQALLLDLLLERRGDPGEGRPVQVERLQRDDLVADEAAHPLQLLLELGSVEKSHAIVFAPSLRRRVRTNVTRPGVVAHPCSAHDGAPDDQAGWGSGATSGSARSGTSGGSGAAASGGGAAQTQPQMAWSQ